MARIYRDALGIPHVRGADLLDVARGQGEATARDRTWQLEWLRRRANGTTAEILGPPGLPWDELARRVRLTRTARRAFDALDAETQAFVAAYAEGVTARLSGDAPELLALGAAPQAWEPWTPVGVHLAHHLLFGSVGQRLWQRRLAGFGDDAHLLDHEGPHSSGSNAWAVGGARTASGRPLIGGDPHRTIESPGVYLQVRLACEDPDDSFDVAGFALAGVPGVQHFAHAGGVAWAITNAMADNQDVVEVHLDGAPGASPEAWPGAEPVVETYVEEVAVAGRPSVDVEVLVTALGPVFEGERGGRALVLVHAAERLGETGLDAVPRLLRARRVADVDAALDHWVEPVNNVVVADVDGRVLYRVAGRVPVRDAAGEWTGWLDPLPREEVAPDGEVVTANERRGPESAAIGSSFAPPFRAQRLRAMLADRGGLTVADFAAMHRDTVALGAEPLVDFWAEHVRDHPGEDVLAGIGWQLTMTADSLDAALLARWRHLFARLVVAQGFLPNDEGHHHSSLFLASMDPVARVGLALPHLVQVERPFGLDLVRLGRDAWALVRGELRERADRGLGPEPTWGETHRFAPLHVFDVLTGADAPAAPPVPDLPLDGDSDCVRCTGSVPGVTDRCSRGSVARYVWDLADREASGWIVPMGASGVPGTAHHLDQLTAWAEGRLAPLVTDWQRLTEDEPSASLG